jgi:hypothetical protein
MNNGWRLRQLGHSFEIQLNSRVIGRQLHRQWLLDARRRYARLAGVQHNLFRPFARRPDPDSRPIDRQPFGKQCWGRRQAPAGDEQQSGKRASNGDKIAS